MMVQIQMQPRVHLIHCQGESALESGIKPCIARLRGGLGRAGADSLQWAFY